MDVFFLIILNLILPVFSLIAIGVFLHRKFKLDMSTLSKLNTYLLMPAVSFTNIYQSDIGGETLLHILGFLLLQSVSLITLSTVVSKIARFDRGLSATFKNSIVLINSGNFGLPVSQLVFQSNPLGMSVQVVVLIFQNLLTYTYGLFNSVSVNAKGLDAVKQFLKNPVIYAALLGLVLNVTHAELPMFVWSPIDNLAAAFVAIALVTLGAQSAYLKLTRLSLPLVLSILGRLIVSPMIAMLIIFTLGLAGTTAQALLIASSFPTSRNSALFALEHGNHPEYAAQAVILSTLLSGITVAVVVYLSNVIF